MTYSFSVPAGVALNRAIPVNTSVSGYTLTAQFSKNSDFQNISFSKAVSGTGKNVTMSLTAGETTTVGDSYYRIRAVNGPVTEYIQNGKIEYIEPLSESVTAANDIVLTPTGVAATDGPAMDAAVTLALSDKRSIYMKPGLYRRTTAWDCRGSGLRIITDGVHAVKIEQVTNNVPIIRVGKDFQDIGGMFLQYGSEQPDTATNANAVEIYKSYLSRYRGFYIYGAARGVYLPQVNYDLGNGDASGNYTFSSRFDDLRVLQFSHTAVDIQSYLATSTGSIFANIYMNNEAHGAATSCKRGVNFLSFDELTILQLNVEGVNVTDDSPVLFNQIRAGKIIGMHFERVKNTQWGSGFLNVNNDTKLSVDGMSVVYCPFANAAGGQADLLGIIKVGDACQVAVNTLNMHSNTSLTSPSRPLVVGWGITAETTSVTVVGSTASTVTTVNEAINTPIGGTAPRIPVLKRNNEDWFHYREANADVTFGTAAPTTGAWERGAKRWNTAPSAAGTPGWVCTTAGTPGTWKAMASLAA